MNDDTTAQRAARLGNQLGASIAAAAPDAFAVLVVSTRSGEGRTTLCEMAVRAPLERPLRLVCLSELQSLSPDEMDADEVLLIDGPAANEGIGLAAVPREWISACDASVIVASRRGSRVDELDELATLLEAMGAPCVGVVMNERDCAAPADGLGRLVARVRRLFSRQTRAQNAATQANEVGS